MENTKPRIRIADTQFAHGTSLGSGDLKIYPKFFDWYRGTEQLNDVILITESMFHKVDEFPEKVKIAWLLEPMTINSESYKWVTANWHKFKFILSHNLDFIKQLERNIEDAYVGTENIARPTILWYPFGGCWIMPEDRKIYPKTKLISIIASGKNETEGHKLRHEVIKAFGNKGVDVFGRGYNPIDYKLDALKDYQYSIVIENERTKGFFTEKVIDCFATGTIPIYWGDNSLCGDFDIKICNNAFDIAQQVHIITAYGMEMSETEKINNIHNAQNNFRKFNQFACPEDWLWLNFFFKNSEILGAAKM